MTTITVKGQVTLPKKVRDAVGLKPGDVVEVSSGPMSRSHSGYFSPAMHAVTGPIFPRSQ
jgi:AbrB family looped-hinge helix DNA binding protein